VSERYDYRPAWDIVMLLLCLGGLGSSGIGAYLGIARMRRPAVRRMAEGYYTAKGSSQERGIL
jgi:hypothetical protein